MEGRLSSVDGWIGERGAVDERGSAHRRRENSLHISVNKKRISNQNKDKHVDVSVDDDVVVVVVVVIVDDIVDFSSWSSPSSSSSFNK